MSERLTVEQIERAREYLNKYGLLPADIKNDALCDAALSGIQRPDLEAAAKVCEEYADELRASGSGMAAAAVAGNCAIKIRRSLATGPAAQGDGVERRVGDERRGKSMMGLRFPPDAGVVRQIADRTAPDRRGRRKRNPSDRRGQARAEQNAGPQDATCVGEVGLDTPQTVKPGAPSPAVPAPLASAEALNWLLTELEDYKAFDAENMNIDCIHDAADILGDFERKFPGYLAARQKAQGKS